MTREQYIRMRNNGNFNIVYEYYREKFDHFNHRPLLSLMELVQILPQVMSAHSAMDASLRYFDQKFDVRILSDKDGAIIKLL